MNVTIITFPGRGRDRQSPSGLSELDAVVADVGDDFQAAAERGDVGGQRAHLCRARFGALDRGDPFLAHVHALRHLCLGQPHPLPGFGEGVGAAAGGERARRDLHLGLRAGEELVEERFRVIRDEGVTGRAATDGLRLAASRIAAR